MSTSDAFFDTMREAMEEAQRRKADPKLKDFLTRVEPSSYGGFRVSSMPAEIFVDQLADGFLTPSPRALKHLIGA